MRERRESKLYTSVGRREDSPLLPRLGDLGTGGGALVV